MKKTSKNILLINNDWRNIFRNNPHELWEKLERDRLNPDLNNFFIFSWAHESYSDSRDNFRTVHKKTRLYWCKPWFDFLSFFSVPKAIEKEAYIPEVVLVYDFGFLPTAWKLKRKYGAQIIMVINNMPRIYSATRKLGWIKSLYSRLLEIFFKGIPDEYFTINEAMKSYLLDLKISDRHIHLFSMNTINRDMEHITQSAPGRIRNLYGIPTHAKVLICVARLEAEKGYKRLIKLFSSLSDDHYLIILGEGSLRRELEELARTLGVFDRITMPGFIKRDQIWNYYQDSDVFVLLSDAEALGVVVWEAMYMRVPVIGSEAPGIVESTGKNGERGIVFKGGDTDVDFKNKMMVCLEGSLEVQKMIDRAHAYVGERLRNTITLNDIV